MLRFLSYLIYRSFVSRDINLLVRAFITYVRPILEYNSVTWSPYYKGDIECIEKVQRRFTRWLPGFKSLTYNQRLKRLNLPSLELRRLHADLVMCYKIVLGLISYHLPTSLHLDLLQSQEDTSINCMLITVVVLENISLLSVWLHLGTVCLLILTLVH